MEASKFKTNKINNVFYKVTKYKINIWKLNAFPYFSNKQKLYFKMIQFDRNLKENRKL